MPVLGSHHKDYPPQGEWAQPKPLLATEFSQHADLAALPSL
jgi:hypothetical protein